MNRIIENEIYKLISRTPTEEELKSALEYLDCCADDLIFSEDIPILLKEWLGDYMAQCEQCYQWGLKSEMVHNMYGYFCDENCEDQDHQIRHEDAQEYLYLNR